MQIAILGPLEVRDDAGRLIEVSGARLRSLLIRLAIDAGRWVSTGALIEAVWGDEPPADEANALQTLVSRARRAVGEPGVIASSSAGYRLVLAADSVDAARFADLVRVAGAAARDGHAGEAAGLLDDALALWRDPALPDASSGPLAIEATRLRRLHTSARIERAKLRAGTGHADLADLATLVVDEPLDEQLTVAHMQALADAGRQADALAAYEALRVRLADELGVDPSAPTRAAHLELLRGELSAPVAAVTTQRRSNLRVPLTSFIGRDVEQQAIRELLGVQRLVTLVGPGGAGKTRLAIESARGYLDEAPDGVWLAELAAVTAGADVAQAVLASIGLRDLHAADTTAAGDAMTRLSGALVDRRLLLVLDNCEHVIDDAARLAETLLGDCPQLRVLATSREPLGIGGESLYPVRPLPRPAEGAGADDAANFAAVALFADRAAAARPDFVLDPTTVRPVIEIVSRLDGLPLAIELAAARLRSMPLDDVAARLSDRFRLLTGGSRTALPRHRTLRAVVEWSWDLLGEGERALIEALAVFPAGVTVSSAEAVRPELVDAAALADVLAALVEKSLVQPIGDGRRFRVLETIREFGLERLAEREQLRDARERHARYFARLLSDTTPSLMTRDQLPSFALLRVEQENILAAVRFLAAIGDVDTALQAAVDLSLWAVMAGEQQESGAWLAEVLAVPGGDERLRLVASATRVVASDFGAEGEGLGNLSRAELDELAEQLAALDTSFTPMLALLRPGIAFLAGNIALAHRLLEDALASSDPWVRASSLFFTTNLLENEGEVDRMREAAERALSAFRELGERWGIANSLRMVGQVRTLDGDLAGAAAAYDESMRVRQELSSDDDTIFLLNELADLAARQGDSVAARGYLDRAIEQAERAPADFESYFAWMTVAEMERRSGSIDRARELAEFGRARLDSIPTSQPVQRYVRAILFRLLAAIALDDDDLDTALDHASAAYAAAVLTNDLPVIASIGVLSADLRRASGDPAGAATSLGAAARLRGAADPTAVDIRALAEALRALLGEVEYDARYEAGRSLGRDAAIAALDPSDIQARRL